MVLVTEYVNRNECLSTTFWEVFMSKMSQKECVFAAVTAFLEENDRMHELDSAQGLQLSKTDKQTIVGMVCAARSVMELSAEADAKFDTPQKFKTYTIGLVNNWLRKDTRLNGGEKYVTKNPGSRAGTGDQTIKALRALKSTLTDADQIKLVDEEIAKRVKEIEAEKAKSVTINVEALPEAFRHLVK